MGNAGIQLADALYHIVKYAVFLLLHSHQFLIVVLEE
jgi:hypothetical protein